MNSDMLPKHQYKGMRDKGGDGGLSPRQHEALKLVLEGKLGRRGIAKRIGINTNTLMEWMHTDAWKAEIKHIQEDCYNEALGLVKESLVRLGEIISDRSDVRAANFAIRTLHQNVLPGMTHIVGEDAAKNIANQINISWGEGGAETPEKGSDVVDGEGYGTTK